MIDLVPAAEAPAEERFDKLAAVLEDARRRPFAYGSQDCFLFALRCIEAQRPDLDVMALVPAYDSMRAARKALKQRGYVDMGSALASVLPEIAPVQATDGDIGIFDVGDAGPAACLVMGSDLIAVAEAGLTFAGRGRLIRAFRV